jgi:hypothetical protein
VTRAHQRFVVFFRADVLVLRDAVPRDAAFLRAAMIISLLHQEKTMPSLRRSCSVAGTAAWPGRYLRVAGEALPHSR